MRIGLLGPITIDGRPFEAGRRERQLLILLASRPGEPVSVDRIVEAMWGESPPSNPANAVQAAVSRLRRAMRDIEVEYSASGYRVLVEPADVDTFVLDRLVRAAREAGDPAEQLSTADRAISLVRGDPPNELTDALPAERARLEDLAVSSAELRADALVALGRASEAITDLEALVDRFPLRERLWVRLIEAMYADGRQAEALRSYRRAASILAEQLGVDPGPELTAAEERVLAHDPTLTPRPERPERSLPSLRTRVWGRSDEIREVRTALETGGLVTLTGPGGVGKTTVAVQAAEGMDRRPWFIDLTAVSDLESARAAVAAELALRPGPGSPIDRVVSALAGHDGLLILDNCEHVIDDAAALATELLDRLPSLAILATSREALGIAGERISRLKPLAASEATDPAVELFLDHARAANPSAISEDDVERVIDICSLVEGLPLAVVLLASTVSIMSVTDIQQRLQAGLHLPTMPSRDRPARHASVDATIDWSVEQVSEPARLLFSRISVFEAPADIDAIVAVCGFDPLTEISTVDALGALTTASLVTFDGSRYRMLSMIRSNAARRLDDGDRVEVDRRYIRFHADVALAIWPSVMAGPDQAEMLARADQMLPDFESALRKAAATDPHRAADLGVLIVWASTLRARDDSSLRLVESSLEQLDVPVDRAVVNIRLGLALSSAIGARTRADPRLAESATQAAERLELDREVGLGLGIQSMLAAHDLDRAVRLVTAGLERVPRDDDWALGILSLIEANLVGYTHGIEHAEAAAARAVELLDRSGDLWRRATALGVLGALHLMRGRYSEADAVHAEVVSLSDHMGLQLDGAQARVQLANGALLAGDLDQAIVRAEAAVAHIERTGGGSAKANALNTLGRVSNAAGEHARARAAHRQALEIYQLLDGWAGVAHSLDSLGLVESSAGHAAAAEELHRRALEINRQSGDPLSVAFTLEGLALALALDDRGDEAARLLGAADRLRRSLGAPLVGGERRHVSRAEALARESTSDFERQFTRGADAEDWRALVE